MSTLKKRIEKKHWCSCTNVNGEPILFILIMIIYDVINGVMSSFERDRHEWYHTEVPLTSTKMVIMRFTFHPLRFDVSINGSNLLRLFLTIVFGTWS